VPEVLVVDELDDEVVVVPDVVAEPPPPVLVSLPEEQLAAKMQTQETREVVTRLRFDRMVVPPQHASCW
jgi:hypothetical protein